MSTLTTNPNAVALGVDGPPASLPGVVAVDTAVGLEPPSIAILRRPMSWGVAVTSLVIIGSVGSAIVLGHRPDAYLGEWTFATVFSAGQLATCAILAGIIGFARRQGAGRRRSLLRSPSMIWWLMAAAFGFLAADEIFEIHERFDLLLHAWLGLVETPLTDRIDDAIVAAYAFLALWFVYLNRRELRRFRPVRGLVRAGFILLFAMVAMDLLTNRWSVPASIPHDSPSIVALAAWANVAEESFKLFAGIAFVMAFVGVAAMVDGRRGRLSHR